MANCSVPFGVALLSHAAFLRPSLQLQWVCVVAVLLSEANNPEIWLQGPLTNKPALQVTSKYLLSRVAFPRRLVSVSAATFPKCLQLHGENLLIELHWVSDALNRQRKLQLNLPFYLHYLHSVAEVSISAAAFAAAHGKGYQSLWFIFDWVMPQTRDVIFW